MEEYKKLIKRLEKADKFFKENPGRCEGKLLEEYHKIVKEISNNILYDPEIELMTDKGK